VSYDAAQITTVPLFYTRFLLGDTDCDNEMFEEAVELFSDNAESIEVSDRGLFRGKEGVRRFFLEFMGRGGRVLLFLSPGRFAEFLPAAELLTRAKDTGEAIEGECRVVAPDHPVARGLPAAFEAPPETRALELEAPGLRPIVSHGDHPVVAPLPLCRQREFGCSIIHSKIEKQRIPFWKASGG